MSVRFMKPLKKSIHDGEAQPQDQRRTALLSSTARAATDPSDFKKVCPIGKGLLYEIEFRYRSIRKSWTCLS